MVAKTFTFFNNTRLTGGLFGSKSSGVIDFFSTLTKATLFWTSSNTNLTEVNLNGTVVSKEPSGQLDVTRYIKNGVKNQVTLHTKPFAIVPATTLYIVVEGVIATFDVVREQNARFIQAYRDKEVTTAQYRQAVEFQNQVAYNMLQAGVITTVQLNDLLLAQVAPDLPKVDPPDRDTGNTDLGTGVQKEPDPDKPIISGAPPFLTTTNVAIIGFVVAVVLILLVVYARGRVK